MFKVVIDEKQVKVKGKRDEILAEIGSYLYALRGLGISYEDIDHVYEFSKNCLKEDEKAESKVKTVYEDEHVKIQKAEINPSKISKEDFKKILNKLFE
ncbi:MAG: hypothetical protein HFJ30_10345 [Clostridia bacterium]|jgi:hypothetical protein|nr:hypothetical protein [Clostridia bacterium]